MVTECASCEVRTVAINLTLERIKVREGEGGCGNKDTLLGVVPGQGVGGSPRMTPHALQLSSGVTALHPRDCTQRELGFHTRSAVINWGAIWQQDGIKLQCFKKCDSGVMHTNAFLVGAV
jgi:hypothetical protein